ncbi:type II secretion system GspH family protein [Candidatus Parcubacteria bacterium]|nr:type II secretion system GspH family protein [Candidatus Parcubacteria bacterium]
MKLKVKSGFTLIELLIVISIIGILAAVLISVIDPAGRQKRARDAIRKQHISQIGKLAEGYFAENSDYPTETELKAGYVKTWPDGTPSSGDDYVVQTYTTTEFCVRVKDETNSSGSTTKYIRYKASVGKVEDNQAGC